MRPILGNGTCAALASRLMLDSSTRTLALTGPSYLGKKTFASDFLEDRFGTSDVLIVDSSIDGARSAREFCSARPAFAVRRAVLVEDVDAASDAAQDAYLKLCEEPPAGSLIVLIAEDEGLLSEALLSRVQAVLRWSRLSEAEFASAVSAMECPTVSARLCDGRPGLAPTVADGAFGALHDLVIGVSRGAVDFIQSGVPAALDGLKGEKSPARLSASIAIRAAARTLHDVPGAAAAFMRLAATLLKVPSANAELHWFRACLASRAVR